jgi:molecular chaperone IbpA
MANILKRESRLRSPLSSLLSDGEKWMVGFDDVFNNLVEKWEEGFDGFHEYPASNIKRIDDHHYRIEIAVAGFMRDELHVDREGDALIVTGSKSEETSEERDDYLQRGIKAKSFRQSFQLTEHDKVLEATLRHGILEINVKRESNGTRKKLGIPIKEV